VYNAIRQPFANFVQRASRAHGLLYQFNAPGFEDVQVNDKSVTAERLSMLGDLIVDDWEYAWSTTAEGDLKKALKDLSMSVAND
jgi:salicylate hydroxylase